MLPENSKRIKALRSARSSKEVRNIIQAFSEEVAQKKSRLRRLLGKLRKFFSFSADESLEVGTVPSSQFGRAKSPMIKDWVKPDSTSISKILLDIDEFTLLREEASVITKYLISNQARLKFTDETLQELKNKVEDIDQSLAEAYAAITDASKEMSKKHAPKELIAVANKLYTHLRKNIPQDAFEHIEKPVVYFAPNPKGGSLFSYFIAIQGLRNTDDYEFDEYYVAVTADIKDTGSMKVYVNTLERFERLGRFDLGHEVSNTNDALRKALTLLHGDSVASSMNKEVITFDKVSAAKRIKRIKGVTDIRIIRDELYIKLSPSLADPTKAKVHAAREKIVEQVLLLLQVLVDNAGRRSKKQFQHKFEESSTGEIYLRVVITSLRNVLDLGAVTQEKLDLVKDILNLDDKQRNQIARYVISRR